MDTLGLVILLVVAAIAIYAVLVYAGYLPNPFKKSLCERPMTDLLSEHATTLSYANYVAPFHDDFAVVITGNVDAVSMSPHEQAPLQVFKGSYLFCASDAITGSPDHMIGIIAMGKKELATFSPEDKKEMVLGVPVKFPASADAKYMRKDESWTTDTCPAGKYMIGTVTHEDGVPVVTWGCCDSLPA